MNQYDLKKEEVDKPFPKLMKSRYGRDLYVWFTRDSEGSILYSAEEHNRHSTSKGWNMQSFVDTDDQIIVNIIDKIDTKNSEKSVK